MARRCIVFALSLLVPCVALAADPGDAPDKAGQAQTLAGKEATTIIQTYDPTSAFDGYWYPAPRAAEGPEDH